MRRVKIFALCALSCITLCATSCDKDESSGVVSGVVSEYYTLQLPSESGVYDWLRGYSKCDFEACDANASLSDFQFKAFGTSMQCSKSLVSEAIYEEMFNKSVESITNVSVDTSDTENEYKVTVTYKPYKNISSVTLDDSEFEKLTDKYVVEDCSLDDYREAVSDFIVTKFSDCFELSDTEQTLEVTLKQGMEGEEMVVTNVSDLIIPLIDNQGISEIVDVFERDIFTGMQDKLAGYSM